MRINKKFSHTLKLGGVALLVTATMSQAGIYYSIHGTHSTLNQKLREQNRLLSAQIKKTELNYLRSIGRNSDRIVEALRAATAQEALSSAQIGKADLNAKQLMVGAMLADDQADAYVDAILKFSSSTGQGYAACKVLAENTQTAQVIDSVSEQAAIKADEGDMAANATMKPASEVFADRTAIHRENFCTDTEAEQTGCEPAPPELQGADSNAETLFMSAPPNSKVAYAKEAVRNNILGTPNIAIPANVAGSIAGKTYLNAINQKTALSAFPAYSLAYLNSMSEVRQDIKDADGNPMSPNDMLFNTVARYYGGKDAADWQASMIKQQPRGLLVELAKMEGLGAWMDYQDLVAMQRMNGNLAAMTITSTLPIEARLKKQHARTVSASLRNNVQ